MARAKRLNGGGEIKICQLCFVHPFERRATGRRRRDQRTTRNKFPLLLSRAAL